MGPGDNNQGPCELNVPTWLQSDFVRDIADRVLAVDGGIGYCYWGGELIAWKDPQATDASPWENQVLFDFNYQTLPALSSLGRGE